MKVSCTLFVRNINTPYAPPERFFNSVEVPIERVGHAVEVLRLGMAAIIESSDCYVYHHHIVSVDDEKPIQATTRAESIVSKLVTKRESNPKDELKKTISLHAVATVTSNNSITDVDAFTTGTRHTTLSGLLATMAQLKQDVAAYLKDKPELSLHSIEYAVYEDRLSDGQFK